MAYTIIEVKKQTKDGISTTVSTTDLLAVLHELRHTYEALLCHPYYVRETVEVQIKGIDETLRQIRSQVKGN